MTQQQMSKLLDIPERTLRDWKKSRHKLYNLLELLPYDEVKDKVGGVEVDELVVFDPKHYSQNLFWQTDQKSKQKVYAIISKYLSTLNQQDIKYLCQQFGKNIVRSVLKDKYKKMYKKGYISTSGIDIPLSGRYEDDKTYKQLLRMINDC